MNPRPTGRLLPTADGRDLVLTRTFRADIEDVWASITESERTARWFASWSGEAAVGASIRYRLEFEEGSPEGDMRIDACEPPHHLAVSTIDEYGTWRLEARLRREGDVTMLDLVHHLDDDTDLGSTGPGWEYYLDMLVASREGTGQPDFDDYYPAQQPYYEALAAESATTRLTRHIRAPRRDVYGALLDPAAVQRWMVPDGMTSEVHAFDAREGGEFHISLTYDDPTAAGKTAGATDTFRGRFARLVPDAEVVQVIEFETPDPTMAGAMTITYRLAEAPGGTELTASHENVPPGVSPADNELGWSISLGKLARLVEAGDGSASRR